MINKETVAKTLRNKAEQLFGNSPNHRSGEGAHDVAALLNELETYELELQLQNEELKASHNTLEIERLKFAGLFNAAPVGYLILDSNGYIKEINQAGLQLLYHPRKLFKGEKLENFIIQDSLYEYDAFIKKIQKSPERLQCEIRLKSKTEDTRYVQLDGITAPVSIAGETAHFITITDVTNSKKALQNLWETTERLNQTLKASLTGTWMVKSAGTQVFLDEYSKDILNIHEIGYDLTLQSLADLFVAEDLPKLNHLLVNCDDDWEIDVELRLKPDEQTKKTVLVKGKIIKPLYGQNYFAGILTDITDRKRSLEVEKEQENLQRRLVQKAAIQAQENERSKISASLHDSVCQILYGIRFNLNHLNKQNQFLNKLDNINVLLDQAIREVRTISVELTPSILKDFGFTAGIKDMLQRLEQAGFHVTSVIDQRADLLAMEIQLYVFRIIQELLNNSIKHSGTNNASVTLCTENNKVSITVSDQGKGFLYDLEESLKQGSGLRGIKNRVSLLNGTLEISGKGGASFSIYFPNHSKL